MTRSALALVLFLIALGGVPGAPAQAARPSARVLFIGNSLTYENNLPAMVEGLAAQAGLHGRIICRGVAKPNFGLEEHWNDGEAVRAIREGHWTHVVLQQGPSSLPESEAILREYAKRFAAETRRRRALVLLFSVWPSRARFASFDAVTASYTHAARDAGGTLVAVGEAWRAAWRRDPALPLYAADGFHPSPAGSYLAALVFFERLTGMSPLDLPEPGASTNAALRAVKLDAAQLRIVRESVTP
jgi:hypothetical protein